MNKKTSVTFLSILLLSSPLFCMRKLLNHTKSLFAKATIIPDLTYGYPVNIEITGKMQEITPPGLTKDKIHEGKVHLGTILSAVTSNVSTLPEEDSGDYVSSLYKMAHYMSGHYSYTLTLYLFALPLCGQKFCQDFEGLEDCIEEAVQYLDDNFEPYDFVTYIGENYFKIPAGTKITDDAYYIAIDKESIKEKFETPKEDDFKEDTDF